MSAKCNSFLISRDALLENAPPKNIDILGILLLDFIKGNKKKSAYGMSLSPSKYDGQDLALISYFLKKFDSLSLTERSGKENIGLSAETVLDPVFLCDRSHFDEIAKKGSVDNVGGLMVYFLNADGESEKTVGEVSRRLGLESVFFHAKSKALDHYFCEDWLCAIKNAQMIITDSYYGICFSIIYEKPFIAVGDESSDFFNLLEMFGLKGRLISSLSEAWVKDGIDYKAVYEKLEKQKSKSLGFLREAVKPFEESKAFSDYDVLTELIAREGGRISKLREEVKVITDVEISGRISKLQKQIKEQEKRFALLAGRRGIYLKYWRYKIMSLVTVGEMRRRYEKKRLSYHEMVRKIRSF